MFERKRKSIYGIIVQKVLITFQKPLGKKMMN